MLAEQLQKIQEHPARLLVLAVVVVLLAAQAVGAYQSALATAPIEDGLEALAEQLEAAPWDGASLETVNEETRQIQRDHQRLADELAAVNRQYLWVLAHFSAAPDLLENIQLGAAAQRLQATVTAVHLLDEETQDWSAPSEVSLGAIGSQLGNFTGAMEEIESNFQAFGDEDSWWHDPHDSLATDGDFTAVLDRVRTRITRYNDHYAILVETAEEVAGHVETMADQMLEIEERHASLQRQTGGDYAASVEAALSFFQETHDALAEVEGTAASMKQDLDRLEMTSALRPVQAELREILELHLEFTELYMLSLEHYAQALAFLDRSVNTLESSTTWGELLEAEQLAQQAVQHEQHADTLLLAAALAAAEMVEHLDRLMDGTAPPPPTPPQQVG